MSSFSFVQVHIWSLREDSKAILQPNPCQTIASLTNCCRKTQVAYTNCVYALPRKLWMGNLFTFIIVGIFMTDIYVLGIIYWLQLMQFYCMPPYCLIQISAGTSHKFPNILPNNTFKLWITQWFALRNHGFLATFFMKMAICTHCCLSYSNTQEVMSAK